MIEFIMSRFIKKSESEIKYNINFKSKTLNFEDFDKIYSKIHSVINDSSLLKESHIKRYDLFFNSKEVLESLLLELYHNHKRLFEFQNLKKFYEYNYIRHEGDKIDYLLIKDLFDKLDTNVRISKRCILAIKKSNLFHQKYWPFKTILDLDRFLISKELKNLGIEPFSGNFITIDGSISSLEYYYKLVTQKIRESNQICIYELKKELNRVEYFKGYSNCSYLNEYISILKSIIKFSPIIELNNKESDLLAQTEKERIERERENFKVNQAHEKSCITSKSVKNFGIKLSKENLHFLYNELEEKLDFFNELTTNENWINVLLGDLNNPTKIYFNAKNISQISYLIEELFMKYSNCNLKEFCESSKFLYKGKELNYDSVKTTKSKLKQKSFKGKSVLDSIIFSIRSKKSLLK